MKPFIVEPNDPLIFGTGKPFTAVPGSRNDSLPLPPPSTLAGLVRSTAGRKPSGEFDTARIPELLELRVLGPILVTLGTEPELAVSPPADALRLVLEEDQDKDIPAEDKRHCHRRLVPIKLRAGDAVSEAGLLPVGLPLPDRSKPPRQAPAYWRWSALWDWLAAPPTLGAEKEVSAKHGVQAPREESRTHVSIGGDGTAETGALFGTVGRRFLGAVDGMLTPMGLYGETDAKLNLPFRGVLGGEGRLSQVRTAPRSLLPGSPPPAVLASARVGFVRVYLLTPAPLGGSAWSPDWGEVIAQASGRPDVISGWAYDAPQGDAAEGYPKSRNKRRRGGSPKPIRRLVPAGSIFFVRLLETGDEAVRRVSDLWGQSIVSGQDARDGFARVLFGVWDGVEHSLST
jgi:CRISPR-associated protein Cmr3